MVRRLSKRERELFSRDLPDNYDPRFFYEYRIMKRSNEATGIEGLVYHLMPWALIRSFAFAIDPLSGFKTAPGRISQVNRTRTKAIVSVLDTSRVEVNNVITRTRAALKNYQGHSGRYGPIVSNPPNVDRWTVVKQSQTKLPHVSKDTTSRTRPFGYSMGEFEKIRPSIHSGPRQIHGYSDNTQYFSTGSGQDYPDFNQSLRTKDYSIGPSAAVFRLDYYNQIVTQERNALLLSMQKNAIPMYKGINPQHRNYSLFRNIVELRDIPRSIATLRESMRILSSFESMLDPKVLDRLRRSVTLSKDMIKNLPNEYLSYNFGWKQLYRDVTDLLVKPEKISRQIDFLILRSGKPTTYRSRRTFDEARSDTPGFSYDVLAGETVMSNATNLTRKVQLDMVINTTFSFPTVNAPKFRNDLFNSKLGVYPRITDLYNLVPWTWLNDWFTGLGNYIEIIDEIHRDQSLINWGFITGKSSIDVTTNYVGRQLLDRSISVNNIGETVFEKRFSNHTSVLHIDLQLRKNVAGIFDVKTTSDPSSLTAYQNSILGALLAQRLMSRR